MQNIYHMLEFFHDKNQHPWEYHQTHINVNYLFGITDVHACRSAHKKST